MPSLLSQSWSTRFFLLKCLFGAVVLDPRVILFVQLSHILQRLKVTFVPLQGPTACTILRKNKDNKANPTPGIMV